MRRFGREVEVLVLLKALRRPGAGGPSGLARLVALAVVVGLVMLSAPALVPVVRWFLSLF